MKIKTVYFEEPNFQLGQINENRTHSMNGIHKIYTQHIQFSNYPE